PGNPWDDSLSMAASAAHCAAQRLLETTNETIERVATCCGFSSAATLRLHFQRLLHTSPQMYRHAFHRENRGER
ncbi:MAG TPA: helix-turn-helix domain-containing protein, partial [Ktedonobacteraceae bacterium]|nr:helix-turn-helix domain-containing protein [Ktedonobacteraceae bacterium]